MSVAPVAGSGASAHSAPQQRVPESDRSTSTIPPEVRTHVAHDDSRPGPVPARRGPRTERLDHQADDWLVGKAQEGSLDAYEAFVRRHRDRIYRIALRMLGNPDDAEDVAQEVVIQLWTALAGFAGTSLFTTWLYRIVVNRCLGTIRRRREDTPLTDPDIVSSPGADAQVMARNRLSAMQAAVTGLPPEQRAPVVLVDIEQLGYDEAAAILGVSEPTLRGRLYRARRRLADTMREWA